MGILGWLMPRIKPKTTEDAKINITMITTQVAIFSNVDHRGFASGMGETLSTGVNDEKIGVLYPE